MTIFYVLFRSAEAAEETYFNDTDVCCTEKGSDSLMTMGERSL